MTDRNPAPPRRFPAGLLGPALALGLAGCGALGPAAPPAAPPALPPAAVAAPAPGDALAAFAAGAAPGQEGVVMENGVASRARLARVYHAASGRECREVVFGSGPAQRARLACRGEDGVFAEARPLLRGGGAR